MKQSEQDTIKLLTMIARKIATVATGEDPPCSFILDHFAGDGSDTATAVKVTIELANPTKDGG